MGLLRKLFGKETPPRGKVTAAEKTAPTSSGNAATDAITPAASPKEVVNYVFNQMAIGTGQDDIQRDLTQRGFHKKTATEYIDLVQKTMFKGH